MHRCTSRLCSQFLKSNSNYGELSWKIFEFPCFWSWQNPNTVVSTQSSAKPSGVRKSIITGGPYSYIHMGPRNYRSCYATGQTGFEPYSNFLTMIVFHMKFRWESNKEPIKFIVTLLTRYKCMANKALWTFSCTQGNIVTIYRWADAEICFWRDSDSY